MHIPARLRMVMLIVAISAPFVAADVAAFGCLAENQKGSVSPSTVQQQGGIQPGPPRDDITTLISCLADLETPLLGLSASTTSGRAFAPLGVVIVDGGMLVDHGLESSRAFTNLIKIGPKAIPFLIKALDDKRATKLEVPFESFPEVSDKYIVTIGDVCYAALGQILGRAYLPIQYVPSGSVVISSPTAKPPLIASLRNEWLNKDPVQHLYDLLINDYQSVPSFNGKNLDDWNTSRITEAARRLLYYYPKESSWRIAKKLDALDVNRSGRGIDDFIKREVRNKVRSNELIRAVSWSNDPLVRAALRSIFKRTNDSQIFIEVMDKCEQEGPEAINARIEELLKGLPDSEYGPMLDGYALLTVAIKLKGYKARPLLQDYLRVCTMQRFWTACLVVRDTKSSWAKDILLSMLSEKTEGRLPYAAMRYSKDRDSLALESIYRVCDLAALVLSQIDNEIRFELIGSRDNLDRQIDIIITQFSKRIQKK